MLSEGQLAGFLEARTASSDNGRLLKIRASRSTRQYGATLAMDAVNFDPKFMFDGRRDGRDTLSQ